MKSFITTLILLSSVLLLSLLNCRYVNAVADDLYTMIDELPPIGDARTLQAAKEIKEFWEKEEMLVELTVSYPFVDRISEQAALLAASAQAKDLYGFESARTLLFDAVKDMRRAEQFSFENLF
ncbi:MAG: DUF4363 family protein [Ruminococcaceae bacterium]|nr:DUF4363 family protein [Oscillospiraceae bacterium]